MRTFAAAKGNGKMPEWSIGPHSKCGVRVTVPGVRIPLFPLRAVVILLFLFLLIRPAIFAGRFVIDGTPL